MRWAYVVSGGPSSTAFLPIPAYTGPSLGYKDSVVGQPGTQGIPAPRPDVPYNDDISAYPFAGGLFNSGAQPPVFYPNLYYQATLDIPGVDPVSGGIRIWSDNQMPIPAGDPRGRAAVLAQSPKFLGQSQITAKKTIPRWPNWLPSPAYGG